MLCTVEGWQSCKCLSEVMVKFRDRVKEFPVEAIGLLLDEIAPRQTYKHLAVSKTMIGTIR